MRLVLRAFNCSNGLFDYAFEMRRKPHFKIHYSKIKLFVIRRVQMTVYLHYSKWNEKSSLKWQRSFDSTHLYEYKVTHWNNVWLWFGHVSLNFIISSQCVCIPQLNKSSLKQCSAHYYYDIHKLNVVVFKRLHFIWNEMFSNWKKLSILNVRISIISHIHCT